MKQNRVIFVFTVLFVLGFASSAWAQEKIAKVVDFPVQLNGVSLSDIMTSTQYPLLVYNDITYFPMTWYNCRMLGLETSWSEKNGLTVKQNNALTSPLGYYAQEQLNAKEVLVTAPSFQVTVNEQVVDNGKEQYPLLNYRDVTYFPLTWRFAHDAFGWDYHYTKADGLQITSHNPKMAAFPVLAGRESRTPIKMLDAGCYYYLEQNDSGDSEQMRVCRAPVDNRFRKQVLYTFSEQPATVEFVLLDQAPYLLYQMKTETQQKALKVNDDGSVEAVQLNLERFTNGSSAGNQQNGWQYAIRDGQLCRSQDGGSWQIYSQKSAAWFGLLDGQVYYLHKTAQGVGEFYQASGNLQDKLVTKEDVQTVEIQDNYLLCKMDPKEDYGVKLFDGQGQLVLAITGPVDMVSVSAGIVMVSTYGDETNEYLYVISLPAKK